MNKTIIGVSLLGVVTILLIVYTFSRGYGKISDNAYKLATATYGACMARSVERINRAESLLENERFRSGISNQELNWFKKIFADARNDRWRQAARAARHMMEDQVE